jgi:hypothetical protein
MPAGIAQQRGHPAIPITTILPGKRDDVLGQSRFVIGPAWHVAPLRSVLPEHTAYPSIGHRHHGLDVIDAVPTPGGAQ